MFSRFCKLYKWYQIVQSITVSGCHGKLNRHSSCIVLLSDLSLWGNTCTCFNPSILKWSEFIWICQVWYWLKFPSFVSLSSKLVLRFQFCSSFYYYLLNGSLESYCSSCDILASVRRSFLYGLIKKRISSL